MIIGAKLTLKKLLHDDSGVAMAFTVLVSLFIFMLCVSTFAMTENIRKKIELQNACDAAAYSGAVVQADILSRIAVLNRALAWTYAQNSKRHMDYVISVWINDINNAYQQYRNVTIFPSTQETTINVSKTYSREVTCSKCGGTGSRIVNDKEVSCAKTETENATITYPPDSSDSRYVMRPTGRAGVRSYSHCFGCGGKHDPITGETTYTGGFLTAGWFLGWDTHEGVNLNYRTAFPKVDVALDTLTTTRSTVLGNGAFVTQLTNERANITTINNAIDYLCRNMNVFITSAISNTMNFNVEAGSTNYTWNCGTNLWGDTAASTYLVKIAQDPSISTANKEAYFLNYNGHTEVEFGTGRNTWWTDKTDGRGIKRGYTQTATALVGRLRYWASVWGRDPWSLEPCHYLMTVLAGQSADITPTLPTNFTDMIAANPVRLQQSFFGKNGAIVVAAKRAMINPFSALFGNDATTAIYGAFNGVGRDIWAVSAARAGVNLGTGTYEARYPGADTTGTWNLCEEDWDAVMLPVARAWNDTALRAWGTGQTIDDTTNALLNSARTALGVRTPYVNPVAKYNPFNPTAGKQ